MKALYLIREQQNSYSTTVQQCSRAPSHYNANSVFFFSLKFYYNEISKLRKQIFKCSFEPDFPGLWKQILNEHDIHSMIESYFFAFSCVHLKYRLSWSFQNKRNSIFQFSKFQIQIKFSNSVVKITYHYTSILLEIKVFELITVTFKIVKIQLISLRLFKNIWITKNN